MENRIAHKTVEHTISVALFRICGFVTVIAMAMVVVRFASRGAFPPDNINLFYVGILTLYSMHKEALHWILDREAWPNRKKGEYFVYGWFMMVAAMYLVNFLSKGWFSVDKNGMPVHVLKEATYLALEVGAIFVASRFVKIARMYVSGRLKEGGTVCIGIRLPRRVRHRM